MQGKLLVRNRSGGAKLLAGLTKRGALRRSCPPAAGAASSLTSLCRTPRLARLGARRQARKYAGLIACTQTSRERRLVGAFVFPPRAPTRVQAANGGWLTQRSQGGGGRRPPGDMSVVDRPPFAATQPLGVQRGANRQANLSPNQQILATACRPDMSPHDE